MNYLGGYELEGKDRSNSGENILRLQLGNRHRLLNNIRFRYIFYS